MIKTSPLCLIIGATYRIACFCSYSYAYSTCVCCASFVRSGWATEPEVLLAVPTVRHSHGRLGVRVSPLKQCPHPLKFDALSIPGAFASCHARTPTIRRMAQRVSHARIRLLRVKACGKCRGCAASSVCCTRAAVLRGGSAARRCRAVARHAAAVLLRGTQG